MAYDQQCTQVAELKKQAEAVVLQIESDAKQSLGGLAGRVAELWRLHPQASEWLARAEKSLATAEKLAGRRSFLEAATELKTAEAEYGKPQQWSTNARQALELLEKTRATLVERISRLPDPPRVLGSWPEMLKAEVEGKLLQDDGVDGPAEARRIAATMRELDGLLELRNESRR